MAKNVLFYCITLALTLPFIFRQVKSCSNGEIRLVNVVGAYQGTLEVCVAGRWNGVCDDDGDSMNQTAAVACRQNGCGVGFAEAGNLNCSEHRFKFQCSGHEDNLTSCDIENSSNCSLNGNSTMCMNVQCIFCPAPVSLLPYGESVGDLRVPSILDTSSGPINLAQNFSFFGSEESTIFVITHGLLSFRSAYIEYSQQPLPINNTVPLILLFWHDTDTSGSGQIFYREVSSIENQTLTLARFLLPQNVNNFNPISIFIATWNQVPPTSGLDGRNNIYQVVLMTDGRRSYVCLLYSRIQWGPGAQIGFNAGDGNRSFTVPGGLTGATLHMESLSNVGRPGLFVYQVDGDEIGAPVRSPTQLIVTQVFQMSLQLRWTNTHSDGVDHFNVYCYHTSCPYCSHLPAVHTVTTSSTIATVTGMTPYTEYGCCVTAVYLNQESDCSEELNISTLPVLPTRPVDVGITEITSTSFKLEWSRPLHIDGTLLYYQIACLQNLNNVWFSTTVNSSVNVSNLKPFTDYRCCISATNQAGEGRSTCFDARTNAAPPTEPEDLNVISNTTSITLTWTEPAETNYGQAILFYSINCTSADCSVEVQRTYATSVEVSGLNANTNYTCCVSAGNSVGVGLHQCIVAVTDNAPPTEPEDLKVISNITSITLTWTEPAESYGQAILFYSINCTSTHHDVEIQQAYNTSVNVFSLISNTNYTCCVSARNSVGIGLHQCIVAVIAKEQPTTSGSNLVTAVSAGVLLAVLLLLCIVITCITCCCCYKRRSKQVSLQNQQQAADPVYEIPGDIELKEKGSTLRSDPQSNDTSRRHVYKEEVVIRYEKPVLTSRGIAMNKKQREKKPTMPIATNHCTQPGQQSSEKIYQPLIPPKTYKEQEVSAYQDLAFETRDAGTDVANNSEGQYEPIRKNNEDNQYEPLSFGGDGGSQEGVYQPLSFQREDDNTYENIQTTTTTRT